MNKWFLLILIIASVLLFFGCGKDYPGGGNVNPGGFQILSRSPVSGETEVASGETIVITFTNPIQVSSFNSANIIPADDHTAGGIMGTISYDWTNSNR
ncbi:MAG: Ig-like domain-containing protein, partial [bacterium]